MQRKKSPLLLILLFTQISAELGPLTDVHFFDENNGITVGPSFQSTSDTYLWTTDGGKNWLQDTSLILGGTNLFFLNDSTGWLDVDPVILKTRNKGKTWALDLTIGLLSFTVSGMVFFDSANGLLVGNRVGYFSLGGMSEIYNNGGIYYTNSSVLSDSIRGIKEIFFLNNNIGWLLGLDLHKTVDGGNSWEKQLEYIQASDCSNPWPGYFSLTFSNDTMGWAVSSLDYDWDNCTPQSKSVLYKTLDAGNNWSIIDSNFISGNFCQQVKFLNDSVGFILGYEDQGAFWGKGNIFKTTDAGSSWQKTDSFNIPLNKIFFVNDSVGWIVGGYELLTPIPVGGGGSTAKDTNLIILKTTNAGESWEVQLFGNDPPVELEKSKLSPLHKNELTINPNPFRPKTTILFKKEFRLAIIRIYDIQGKMIENFANLKSNSITWDASGLPSGVYILKATIDGQQYSKKFLLQK